MGIGRNGWLKHGRQTTPEKISVERKEESWSMRLQRRVRNGTN